MLYAIAAVIALIVDQAVKYWTTAHVVLNSGQHRLIPGFIRLANVHNTGAAFSFMEGARWFFVVLCVLFVAALIYLLTLNIIRGRLARWMAVMVMAGALGNCIDRVINGYVVDMFEFEFLIFGQQFPVFNVADILITVCGIAFCVCILLEKPEDEKTRRRAKRPAAAGRGAGRTGAPGPRQGGQTQGRITQFPGTGSSARQTRSVSTQQISSDDPFAEWERHAAPRVSDIPGETVIRRGENSAGSYFDGPMSHVRPAQAPEERPVTPPPQQQHPPVRPAADDNGFDLEDILAEFRDL